MGRGHSDKKVAYFEKFTGLCNNYSKVLIVLADHVGSRQMAEIRLALRGKATLLMGKNTMIRTALRKLIPSMPQLERLVPLVKDNIGLVFCKTEANDVRKIVLENRVPAPAKQGVVAPMDVVVPAGNTGMDPSQTSFFQALGISTKIVKGQIEIQNDVPIIQKDTKVTASQAVLLQKLNIRPFTYGLKVCQVYDDGSVYDASVLDITDDQVRAKFLTGVTTLAAFSRAVGLPNRASAPHALVEGFRNICAVVLEQEGYTFPLLESMRNAAANAPAAPAGGAPAAGGAAAPAAEEKAPEPEEEEEDEDMGFSLFD